MLGKATERKDHMCFYDQRVPRLCTTLALMTAAVCCWAQDAAKSLDIGHMCPAVVATVLVGKVSCSASLCNTGAAQGGWLGLATQIAHRGGAIDAGSFSTGMAAQLATALKQTGCFNVIDAASIDEARREMESLGRAPPQPPKVEFVIRSDVTRADLVIDESRLFAYTSRSAKTSLGIDVKVVAVSGDVFDAGSYDAAIEQKSSGIDVGIYRSGDDAAKRATPFAEVSRDLILKTARGLTNQILSHSSDYRKSTGEGQNPPMPAAIASAGQ